MGLVILLGLLALPLAEIAGFVAVGGEIGVLATLALVVLGFFAGMAVLRLQGVATALEVQKALSRDELPARALFDGACRVLAGLLLMLPGFVSDAVAILLLLRPVRDLLFRAIARRVAAHGAAHLHAVHVHVGPDAGPGRSGARTGRGKVIEGEFEEVDPDAGGPAAGAIGGPADRRPDGRPGRRQGGQE